MPLINRASLTPEFMDITSKLLLVQPEPQYVYAQLFKIALNAALTPDSELGFMPARAIAGTGAPYTDEMYDRLIFEDPIMKEAFHVVPELSQKGVGHTVRINRPKFANTTYTLASRTITGTISTTPTNIESEQVPLTVVKLGGPYDQGQGAVAPYGVDRLDAGKAVHSLAGAVGKHLKRDFDKTVDSIVATFLDASSNVLRPRGFSADNDTKTAGDAPMDYNTLTRVESTLDNANVPVFANGRRVMVLDATQLQQVKDDRQFGKLAEFHPPVNPLLAQSYYKSIAGFDVYKSTSLNQTANSSSVNIHYGHAFGPGILGAGIDEMPHTAYSTADDYGQRALVIWLMYAGLGLLDSRFGASIRTS